MMGLGGVSQQEHTFISVLCAAPNDLDGFIVEQPIKRVAAASQSPRWLQSNIKLGDRGECAVVNFNCCLAPQIICSAVNLVSGKHRVCCTQSLVEIWKLNLAYSCKHAVVGKWVCSAPTNCMSCMNYATCIDLHCVALNYVSCVELRKWRGLQWISSGAL